MTQKEATAIITSLKWFFDANGLYASIQKVHNEHQVVIRKGNVYVDTIGTNSRIGKTTEDKR